MHTAIVAADELLAAPLPDGALSLGFHIILSCFGVAVPAMIYVVHRRGIRHEDAGSLALARKWGKASAVLFAVAGLGSLALLRRRRWALARLTAVVAVATIVVGWGVARYADLRVDELTIDAAAGPARR
jgi:hypothetical protein